MSKIKPILAALFGSKKFILTMAAILVWLAGKGGLALTEADVTPVLYLLGGLVGAIGLADFGKESTKESTKFTKELVAAEAKKTQA
jgi:uncharacterized membrane protein YuzA (DUF378 family)